MRIAIVSDYLDPADWGGASRVAAAQARALGEAGHDVLLTGASGHDATFEAARVRHVHWLHPGGLRGAWRLRSKTLAALKDFAPDRAVVHQPLSGRFVQQGLPSLPTTYFFHSSWRDERAARGRARAVGVRHRIESSALRAARAIQVTSPFTQEVLARHHPGEAPRAVMNSLGVWSPPHIPDLSARGRLAGRIGLDPGRPILATFRRLVPRTGVERLLEAMTRVPAAQLLVGGDGPRRERIEHQIRESGLSSRVRLLGYVDEAERIETLQGADVTVVPTLELEGFGLATLESMACGTPVAVTPVGNNPRLVNDVQGGCVSADVEAGSLAACIEETLAASWDGTALSRRVVSAFSWRSHADRLLA